VGIDPLECQGRDAYEAMGLWEAELTDALLSLAQDQDRLLRLLRMICTLENVGLGPDVTSQLDNAQRRMNTVRQSVTRHNR